MDSNDEMEYANFFSRSGSRSKKGQTNMYNFNESYKKYCKLLITNSLANLFHFDGFASLAADDEDTPYIKTY